MKKVIVLMALICVMCLCSSAFCQEKTYGLGVSLVKESDSYSGMNFNVTLEALKQTSVVLVVKHVGGVSRGLKFYQVVLAKSESVIVSGLNMNYEIRLKEIYFERRGASFEVIRKHF